MINFKKKLCAVLLVKLLLITVAAKNQNIACYSINKSFKIPKSEELTIPVIFLNPKGLRLDLGRLLPTPNKQNIYCVPTEYRVLFRKSRAEKFKRYILDQIWEGSGSENLSFSDKRNTIFVYIPNLLTNRGEYKFKFRIYYLIGSNPKRYSTSTNWLRVYVK